MDLRMVGFTGMLALLLTLCCVPTSNAQQYHFSNGWFPGRKRSSDNPPSSYKYRSSDPPSMLSSTSSATSNKCVLRPQIQQLMMDLIQAEVVRMMAECHLTYDTLAEDTSRTLLDQVSGMLPDQASRALADQSYKIQDITKWIQRLRDERVDNS